MKQITRLALSSIITILIVSVVLAGGWQTLPVSYYKTAVGAGRDVQVAEYQDTETATLYSFDLRFFTGDSDSALIYIPLPVGTTNVGLTWSASSTDDSLYIQLKYGSVFDLAGSDSPIYYKTLQDTSLYWYKNTRQYVVEAPRELLASRYFVVNMRSSYKLAAYAYINLRVTVPK